MSDGVRKGHRAGNPARVDLVQPMMMPMPALLALLLAQAPSAGPSSIAPAFQAIDDQVVLPHGLRLLTESLRVPFAEDWGGEMRAGIGAGNGIGLSGRLSFGAFMKAWSEGVCAPGHSCRELSIHSGVDARLRVTPTLDVNLNYEIGKGPATGRGPMLRIRWKF